MLFHTNRGFDRSRKPGRGFFFSAGFIFEIPLHSYCIFHSVAKLDFSKLGQCLIEVHGALSGVGGTVRRRVSFFHNRGGREAAGFFPPCHLTDVTCLVSKMVRSIGDRRENENAFSTGVVVIMNACGSLVSRPFLPCPALSSVLVYGTFFGPRSRLRIPKEIICILLNNSGGGSCCDSLLFYGRSPMEWCVACL